MALSPHDSEYVAYFHCPLLCTLAVKYRVFSSVDVPAVLVIFCGRTGLALKRTIWEISA